MSDFAVVHKKTGKVACRTHTWGWANREAQMLNRLYQTDNFEVHLIVSLTLDTRSLEKQVADFQREMEEATR